MVGGRGGGGLSRSRRCEYKGGKTIFHPDWSVVGSGGGRIRRVSQACCLGGSGNWKLSTELTGQATGRRGGRGKRGTAVTWCSQQAFSQFLLVLGPLQVAVLGLATWGVGGGDPSLLLL